MIWYSAVSICFDELTGKHSVKTTSPGLCQGGDGSTGSEDCSGEMGINGFRWSHGQAKRRLQEAWNPRETREILRLKQDGKELREMGQIHNIISPIYNKVQEQSLVLTVWGEFLVHRQ